MAAWATFYFEVLSANDYNSMCDGFSKAIEKLKKSYRRISAGSVMTDVDYTLVENRYAYLYLYGACHSAMVESIMTSYIDSDKREFLVFAIPRHLTTGYLKICSLGGGAGCDVLGLRAAVYKAYSVKCESVVVDKYGHWMTQFSTLADRKKYAGDRNSFVVADLLDQGARERCKATIKSSDVICMVKFLSVLFFQNAEECKKMIKFIFEEMRPEALLIFIDNAGGGFYETMLQVAFTIPHLTLCYQKTAHKFSFQTDETITFLYRLLYATTPLTTCKVSFAVWRKKKPVSLI